MTEHRCPNCEALMIELDCLECVAHSLHQVAVKVMDRRMENLAPPTRTHCAKGHEMTEENTRVEVRVTDKQSISRSCKLCHNARAVAQRQRERTRPRELGKLDRGRVAPTGRMTIANLPPEGTT